MRGANICSAIVIFLAPGYLALCLRVSASVSYILRSRKGHIPGTMAYVIYSPGTAPRATCARLFLFRFSIAMKKNNSFQLVRTAFPSFFSFPFLSEKTLVSFFKVQGARSLVSPLERSKRTQLHGLQSSVKCCSKV